MTDQSKPTDVAGGVTDEDESSGHGVELACYLNGPLGLCPWFECSCGWTSTYGAGDWEEAGQEFDEHLSDGRKT